MVEKESEFTDFSIYRMRVLDGMPGKDVAAHSGLSEPTISRSAGQGPGLLRVRVCARWSTTYSFTEEELHRGRAKRTGAESQYAKADDALFDEAIAEIYHRQMDLRRRDDRGRPRGRLAASPAPTGEERDRPGAASCESP
jgi:hypothetical protein